MARQRRNKELTTVEKIENLKTQIADAERDILLAEEKLHELRNDKKELEDKLHQEKIALLLETMEEKNISLDMAKEIIDNVNV